MTATAMYVLTHVLPVSAALLPPQMDSPAARAMLMAVCSQESGFRARRQIAAYRHDRTVVYGPARGWAMFEQSGVADVLLGDSTRTHVLDLCTRLGYPPEIPAIHTAIEHHDVLAVSLARLLLWKDPRPMPTALQPNIGWGIYLARWRPGKPHESEWGSHFSAAWAAVTGGA